MKGEEWLYIGNWRIKVWFVCFVIIMIMAFIYATIFYPQYYEQPTTPPNFECGEYEGQKCRIESFYNDLFSECTYDFDECTEEWVKEKLTERLLSKGNITDIKDNSVDVWIRKEDVVDGDKIGTREKCCYDYFWKYVICEPSKVCTNKVWEAYCNGSPDECNERYGIEIGKETNCRDCGIPPSCNEEGTVCGGCGLICDIEKGFECVEWLDDDCPPDGKIFKFSENLTAGCVYKCFTTYEDEHITCFSQNEPCTLSKLTCYDSKQECERRYS